jgi:hypothetical protein
MAISARRPKPTLVDVLFGMTIDTLTWRIPVVPILAVTARTFGLRMCECQRELCQRVVEHPAIAIDYVRISAFVISMTGNTLIVARSWTPTVKPFALAAIEGDALMTARAQFSDRRV